MKTINYQKIISNLTEGLKAVFGRDIKVELDTSCGCDIITVDGWLCFSQSESEKNKWDFSILKFYPATRHEPEDVDIIDVGTFTLNEIINKEILPRIASNLYSNWSDWKAEQEMPSDSV